MNQQEFNEIIAMACEELDRYLAEPGNIFSYEAFVDVVMHRYEVDYKFSFIESL